MSIIRLLVLKRAGRGAETRRGILSFVAAFLLCCALPAAELNDGVDRTAPDFIKASLLIIGPGEELFSCAGHACLRLECPTFKLDNCFSYESENVRDRIWTFFRGKLKMGMFAIPTAEFLKEYAVSGRGVTQYTLNLPPDVKQRLWKILDERVAQGANLPYNHIRRGCALSVIEVLRQAIGTVDESAVHWPEKYRRLRREIIADAIANHPWKRFFIHSFVGVSGDRTTSNFEKLVIPADLLDFLRKLSLGEGSVIAGEGVTVIPASLWDVAPWFTPMVLAAVFVLAALGNLWLKCPYLDWTFLGLQTLFGIFLCYLVFCSDLPGTDWNWLLVPFNPLPLFFWKWRRRWASVFCAALTVWAVVMFLFPQRYTDPAYAAISLAYVLFYLKFTWIPLLLVAGKGCKK